MWRFVAILLVAVGVACGGPEKNTVIEERGTIGYQNLEGGWWFIQADSGKTYTPTSIPAELKVPGIRVQATLVLRNDLVSTLPGPFVDITAIQQLPPS